MTECLSSSLKQTGKYQSAVTQFPSHIHDHDAIITCKCIVSHWNNKRTCTCQEKYTNNEFLANHNNSVSRWMFSKQTFFYYTSFPVSGHIGTCINVSYLCV